MNTMRSSKILQISNRENYLSTFPLLRPKDQSISTNVIAIKTQTCSIYFFWHLLKFVKDPDGSIVEECHLDYVFPKPI